MRCFREAGKGVIIIVVVGIVLVTSRIVRGWVRRNVRTFIGSAHPLEKSAPGFENTSIYC
jgi:hypothetical protein